MELIIENKTNSPKSIKVSVVYEYETALNPNGSIVVNEEMLRKGKGSIVRIEILEG